MATAELALLRRATDEPQQHGHGCPVHDHDGDGLLAQPRRTAGAQAAGAAGTVRDMKAAEGSSNPWGWRRWQRLAGPGACGGSTQAQPVGCRRNQQRGQEAGSKRQTLIGMGDGRHWGQPREAAGKTQQQGRRLARSDMTTAARQHSPEGLETDSAAGAEAGPVHDRMATAL